jgi:protein SCO1
MKLKNAFKSVAACATLVLGFGLVAACSEKQQSFTSIDLTGATYAKDFELTDHNGQVRHLKDFVGKVVIMFFGFTQCPDMCPTTILELAEVKKNLGKDGDRFQALFVTVDPERDTPEILKAYMTNFDPTFLALTTTLEKLAELAKDYKVYYRKVPGKTPTSYTIDHSAGSYVYDTKGQLRLFTRYGTGATALTQDIQQLLK